MYHLRRWRIAFMLTLLGWPFAFILRAAAGPDCCFNECPASVLCRVFPAPKCSDFNKPRTTADCQSQSEANFATGNFECAAATGSAQNCAYDSDTGFILCYTTYPCLWNTDAMTCARDATRPFNMYMPTYYAVDCPPPQTK